MMQHPPKKRVSAPWSARRRAFLSLTALALAAGFAALGLSQRERPVPAVENPASAERTLDVREADTLASVSVSPYYDEPYELEMRNGHLWLRGQDGPSALDESRERELLDALTRVVVQDTVAEDASEVQEHLEEMGLAPALASATVRYTDGTQAIFEVGASVPHTPYTYFRWSGDSGVHMCTPDILDALSLSAQQLLPVAELQISPSLVESLRLTNQSGALLFRFSGGASGTLEEPFAYPLASEGVSSLLSALQNVRLGSFQAVLTEENRAQYGFDNPVCVLEIAQKAGEVNEIDENGALFMAKHEAKHLRLELGRAEDAYYYTCAYEGSCYLVSRFLVEVLVKAQSGSFLTRNPARMDDGTLVQAHLRTQTEELLLKVDRSEQVLANNELATDAAGNILWDVAARLNGETITEEQLNAFLDQLNLLAVAGDLQEDFVPAPDAVPRWTLVLQTDSGQERTLEAYRMDAFSDALFLNGVSRHYVHADAIDALLTFLPS